MAVMETLATPIVMTATYVASTTAAIDILLDGYITQIDVDVTLSVTSGTSVTPMGDDGPLRIIRALKLTASGAKDFVSYRDGREAYWLSWLKSQGQAVWTALPAANATADVTIQFSIHPGSIFGNPYDLTRCIPLRGLSNMQMQITWGTAANLGTGYTVNSGNMTITVYRQVLKKGQSEADAFAPLSNIMVPRYVPVEYAIDAIYASWGFPKNIQTGAYYRDVMLMVLTSADVRTNANVTQLNVSDNKGNTPWEQRDFARWLRMVRQRLYLPSTLTGVGMVFFKDITARDYGLDMVGASLGDWMLQFTTAVASGTIKAVYEGADMVSVDPTEVGK